MTLTFHDPTPANPGFKCGYAACGRLHSVSREEVSKALEEAMLWIDKGWCQGSLCEIKGVGQPSSKLHEADKWCAVGSIYRAVMDEPISDEMIAGRFPTLSALHADDISRAASHWLSGILLREEGVDGYLLDTLTKANLAAFNDWPGRKKEDVLNLFSIGLTELWPVPSDVR